MVNLNKFKKLFNPAKYVGIALMIFTLGATVCEWIAAIVIILFALLINHFILDQYISMAPYEQVILHSNLVIAGEYNNDHDQSHIIVTITREDSVVVFRDTIEAFVGRGHVYMSEPWYASGLGRYVAKAQFFDNDKGRPFGRHSVTEDFSVIEGEGEPKPYFLKIWCGQETKGNPGEELNLPYAHPLAVEIIDPATGGMPSEPVNIAFKAHVGSFTGGADSVNLPAWETYVGDRTIRMAYVPLILSYQIPAPGNYIIHVVTASSDKAYNTVNFTIYSLNDAEKSHGIGTYTHQKNYPFNDTEISGDNYLDDGDATDYKNVRVELDWYKWNTSVDTSTIEEIADFIDTILETAGIHAEIVVGNEIQAGSAEGQMPDSTDRQKRMGLLSYHKEPLSNYDRIWSNSIHVILGSNYNDLPEADSAMGIMEDYSSFYLLPENTWRTMRWASSGIDFSKYYLDSVGCFVFVNRILNCPYLILELKRAIALVSAHEIGHALGMWHYPIYEPVNEYHVMIVNMFSPFNDLAGFDKYGRFAHKTLDGSFDLGLDNEPGGPECLWDAMNTRHVVGINSVNFEELQIQ